MGKFNVRVHLRQLSDDRGRLIPCRPKSEFIIEIGHGGGVIIVFLVGACGNLAQLGGHLADQIAGAGRDFPERPVLSVGVVIRGKLPIFVGRVLLDQLVPAIHAVFRASQGAVALGCGASEIEA